VLLGDGVVCAGEGVFVGLTVDAGEVLLGGFFVLDVLFCGVAVCLVLLGGVGGRPGLSVGDEVRFCDGDRADWAAQRQGSEDGSCG